MPSFIGGEPDRRPDIDLSLAGDIDPDREQVLLDRGDLCAGIEDALAVLGNEFHVSSDVGDSGYCAKRVAEVEVLVAVSVVSAVDESAGESEPMQRVRRFHPFFIVLSKYGSQEFAVAGPVHIQVHMLLAPVQNLDEDQLTVRRPGNIGEVLVVAEIVRLDVCSRVFRQIVNAYAHILRAHSAHRIFYALERTGTCGDVQKREFSYLTFILAVERDAASVR